MQRTMATQLEADDNREVKKVPLADKRHFAHKRLERWVRLQQFVYGLPDDYSYAVCLKEAGDGRYESRSLVKVGWMCWFGSGTGVDRQHALAISLLNTVEAVSANSTAVFFHRVNKLVCRGLSCFRRKGSLTQRAKNVAQGEKAGELLAG